VARGAARRYRVDLCTNSGSANERVRGKEKDVRMDSERALRRQLPERSRAEHALYGLSGLIL